MRCFWAIAGLVLLLNAANGVRDMDMNLKRKPDPEWVDPTDMFNYDHTTKTMINKQDSPGVEETSCDCPAIKSCECEGVMNHLEKCEETRVKAENNYQECRVMLDEKPASETAYFRQFINVLRNYMDPNVPSEETVRYELHMELSGADLEKLEEFGQNGGNNIQDVHDILLHRIRHMRRSGGYAPKTWNDVIGESFENNKNILILLVISVALLVCANLLMRITWSQPVTLSKLLFWFTVILFFISVPWNWWMLYQEKLASQSLEVTKSIPRECVQHDLSWWQTFKTAFKTGPSDCEKYYRALYVDPLFEIAPTQALAVTLTKFLLEPVQHLGEAFGKMLKGIMNELPFYMWPVAILLLCIFIVFFTLVQYGYKLNLFHVIGLEPAKASLVTERDMLQSRVQELQIENNRLRGESLAGLEAKQSSRPAITEQPYGRMTQAIHPIAGIEEVPMKETADSSEFLSSPDEACQSTVVRPAALRQRVRKHPHETHSTKPPSVDDLGGGDSIKIKYEPMKSHAAAPVSLNTQGDMQAVDFPSPESSITSSKDITPCSESSRDITSCSESSKDITPCSESSRDITSCSESSKDITPCSESSRDITSCGESSKDITPCSESSDDTTLHQIGTESVMMTSTGSFVEVQGVVPSDINSVGESDSDIEIIEQDANLSLD